MSFFSSFDAQEDPPGGVSRRDLNLGGFTAPLVQQAFVLSQALLVVMLKQMVPLMSLANTILYAVSLPLRPVVAEQVLGARRRRSAG
jgi:hypothetical protein